MKRANKGAQLKPARLSQYQPIHLPAWTGPLTSLGLCFSICKMGMVIFSVAKGCAENEMRVAGALAHALSDTLSGLEMPKANGSRGHKEPPHRVIIC